MNLAEKIITLRTNHNMSQGDLAEKLNVSRQSVSKWETGASIPDLEKLIAISELFGITLDELVKGSRTDSLNNTNDLWHSCAQQSEPAPQVVYVQTPAEDTNTFSTQRIIGFILLVTGIIGILLDFLTSSDGLLAFLGLALIFGSIVCLTSRKNAGLKIAWSVAILMFIFTFPSGLLIDLTSLYTIAGFAMFSTWIFILILIIITITKKRKKK